MKIQKTKKTKIIEKQEQIFGWVEIKPNKLGRDLIISTTAKYDKIILNGKELSK